MTPKHLIEPQSALARRHFLQSSLGMMTLASGFGFCEVSADIPRRTDFPEMEFVYTALVSISPLETVGETPAGVQRIIPITGGTFAGPRIRGTILPGSADWNLQRNDGTTVVSASYFMRSDDGILIKIVNQGINPKLAPSDKPKRPRFTNPSFEAPRGRYEWLNQSVFVGTLAPIDSSSVRIRVFKLV
jgi:Protein of unknown function (DUF3237)